MNGIYRLRINSDMVQLTIGQTLDLTADLNYNVVLYLIYKITLYNR